MSIQFQSATGINQVQTPPVREIEEISDFPPMPQVSEPKKDNSGVVIGSLVGLAGLGIASIALHKNYVNKKQVAKLLEEQKGLKEQLKAAEEKLAETAEKDVNEHWWNRLGEKIKDKYGSAKEKASEKWKNFRKPKEFDAHEYYENLRRVNNPTTLWGKIKKFFSFKK